MNTKAIASLLFFLCIILTGCSSNSSSNTPTNEPAVNNSDSFVPPPDSPLPEKATPSNTPGPSLEIPSAVTEDATEAKPQQPVTSLSEPVESKPHEQPQEGETMPNVTLRIGNWDFTVMMYDNKSARAIIKQLPFTLTMNDYSSQEKVTNLTFDLPSAKTVIPATINVGDIYLWSGNRLVLFYNTFYNSYSYVPIGHITNIEGLIDALGSGSVEVTFSIQE